MLADIMECRRTIPIFDGNNISRLTSRDAQRWYELSWLGRRVTIHELREHLGSSKTNSFSVRDHARQWWRTNATQKLIVVDSNDRDLLWHGKLKCRAGVDHMLTSNVIAGHYRERWRKLVQPVNETLLSEARAARPCHAELYRED